MQSTGILRRVDDLGRINLPRSVRETMNIQTDDCVEFFIDKAEGMVGIRTVEIEKVIKEDVINYFRNLTTEEQTDFILTLLSESEEVTKSVIYDIFERKF